MEWLPGTVMQGGPWAILLSVVSGVCFLFWRGSIMSAGQVDKTIAGYVSTNATLEKELTFWRAAAERKDATIATQAEQLSKLMAYSAVGTHALEAVLKEANRREVGEAHD